eukprot:TRINITY_DN35072_c0_g1_i5.p1 TRINITY_DN35072_c0_g1~~TRINITY_DN35072_c0_g1_i5.p1  ORF type:complete len:113 (+),score=7.60 TRINITY_DN35072_c0_g1_i5:72-410(+)
MFRLLFPASAALAAASTMAHRGAVTSTQTRTETIVEGREFAAVRKLLSGADAAALYPRKWQEVSSSACLQQSAKFRIAQFNILADGLLALCNYTADKERTSRSQSALTTARS